MAWLINKTCLDSSDKKLTMHSVGFDDHEDEKHMMLMHAWVVYVVALDDENKMLCFVEKVSQQVGDWWKTCNPVDWFG